MLQPKADGAVSFNSMFDEDPFETMKKEIDTKQQAQQAEQGSNNNNDNNNNHNQDNKENKDDNDEDVGMIARSSISTGSLRQRSKSQTGEELLSPRQIVRGGRVTTGAKYFGPRMKVLMWNDKTKSFVHIIRCNRMMNLNLSDDNIAKHFNFDEKDNNNKFYEIRRSYNDFEYLHFLLNNTVNNNNNINNIDSQLLLFSVDKKSKNKSSKSNKSRKSQTNSNNNSNDKNSKSSKSKRERSKSVGIRGKTKHKKKSSFLGNRRISKANSNKNNLNNDDDENTNGLLANESKTYEDEKVGQDKGPKGNNDNNNNNNSNSNSNVGNNNKVLIEIPALPDRIVAGKGLFPVWYLILFYFDSVLFIFEWIVLDCV